jgi:hypothetical protein
MWGVRFEERVVPTTAMTPITIQEQFLSISAR